MSDATSASVPGQPSSSYEPCTRKVVINFINRAYRFEEINVSATKTVTFFVTKSFEPRQMIIVFV